MMHRARTLFLALLAAGFGFAAGPQAAEKPPAAKGQAAKHGKKKIRMNEPMTNKMMKKGMMKGDVKKANEENEKAMEPMMEQEEKMMPPEPKNP